MLRVAVAWQHGLERLMRPGQFRRGPLPAAIKTSWSGNCQPQGTCPSWHTWLSSPRKSRSARFPGAPRIQSGSQACRRTTRQGFCQVLRLICLYHPTGFLKTAVACPRTLVCRLLLQIRLCGRREPLPAGFHNQHHRPGIFSPGSEPSVRAVAGLVNSPSRPSSL